MRENTRFKDDRTRFKDDRTIDAIKKHYEVEKALANVLRNASKDERRKLYSSLYDELFRRITDHPMIMVKSSPEEKSYRVTTQMRFLSRFLRKSHLFLEIGPGDCSLSFAVADCVEKVFAADVSEVIAGNQESPGNCELIIFDGCNIPLPRNTIDIAYSNQLMEHLHPDDAIEQLRSIYEILKPTGKYICSTPNAVNGPHDVSKYFDEIATGFHLKEYTNRELGKVFHEVGFSKVDACIGYRGRHISIPFFLIALFENLISLLPYSLRRLKVFRPFLGILMVGTKQSDLY